MKKQLTGFVALLRGINVGGHNLISMPALCSLAEDAGCDMVKSCIQSGNLVFSASESSAALEAKLEAAIGRRFKLAISVVVRAATDWKAYLQSNPFAETCADEPNRVMLALSKALPKPDAVQGLSQRAANGERIRQVGDALWIHFPEGAGKSKLTPSLLDRLVGSPVTMRNWRTVIKLGEMLTQA